MIRRPPRSTQSRSSAASDVYKRQHALSSTGRNSMLFSLLYFLVRRLLGAGGRLQDEKEVELLVLRHQVKVLQRQVKRPRLNRLDRVLLAAASRAMTRSSWSSFVVRPETLLRWHRGLVRKKWTHRRTGPPGRPPIEPDVRDLIATTVRTILLRAGLDPSPRRAGPTWTPVPPVTGGGDPRDRLLHRRDDWTEDDLRPVLHRALDPPSARGRCHRAPRLGVGPLRKPGISPPT